MGKIARRGLWIAGESVSGEQSRWFATLNPATDEVICEVAEAGDGGKPISETPEADVDSGADCLEYFAGQALTRHPGIAKISLTEEAGTGKKFMGRARNLCLRVQGKTPVPSLNGERNNEAANEGIW